MLSPPANLPPMDPLELSLILTRALASDRGLLIETNNADTLRRRLYAARKDQPEFQCLSFAIDPREPTTRLMIIKK